ncbi:MAG: glycosyltransferase family 4 protein [Chloroflexi bacterium]|nr:glycosyltransferase family 4 protein [Chloroflexota bacterium]
MRVILATTQFMPEVGGVPRLLWKLCVHKPASYELSILSVYQQPIETYREFDRSSTFKIDRVKPMVKGGITSLRFFFQLLANVWKSKVDVILCGVGFPTAIIASWVNLLSGVPYAVYTHSEDLTIQKKFDRRLLGWALDRAQAVFVLGDFGRKQLESLGVTRPPIYVAPPGIDPEPFLEREKNPPISGIKGSFILLTVARLVRRKGQDLVIQALPELRKIIPGIQYVVVGKGPDELVLRNLADELGVSDLVFFAGGVSDDELPSYFQACDVFVMPTRPSEDEKEVEGFGIVFLEAGAAGKPVLAGHSGGVDAAVQDGETGYLIEPTSVDDLVRHVQQLEADSELKDRLGNAGRERVLEGYTAKIFSTKVFKVLEMIQNHPQEER